MLDSKLIRDTPELIKQALIKRGHDVATFEALLAIDRDWRDHQIELDELRHQRNTQTPKGKPSIEQQESLKALSARIKVLQDKTSQLDQLRLDASLMIPNIPHHTVPSGLTESENVVIKTVGVPPTFDFEPLPHETIALNRKLIDFEAGARIAGSRFAVYTGMGAQLERALIHFMLAHHTKRGYDEVMPPVLVNRACLMGTGQLPKFEDDLFKVNDTDFYLSPTAEVQLTNLYANQIIPESSLPICHVAHTPCFRKEAGSYGKDMAGIIRQHQFNKVELVKIVTPDQATDELHAMLSDAESVLDALGLPYRVIQLCGGDLGFSSAITYDIEVWFPSQGKYREISSVSHFSDFQSRRSMIRYRPNLGGDVEYAHTLNGSGLAVGRTFAAILENFQQSDGAVIIPAVLSAFFYSHPHGELRL